MKQIPRRRVSCEKCKTVFSFSNQDIVEYSGEKYVHCPVCNKANRT